MREDANDHLGNHQRNNQRKGDCQATRIRVLGDAVRVTVTVTVAVPVRVMVVSVIGHDLDRTTLNRFVRLIPN